MVKLAQIVQILVRHVPALPLASHAKPHTAYKATCAVPVPQEPTSLVKLATLAQVLVIHVPALLFALPAKPLTVSRAHCAIPAPLEPT